MSLPWCCRCVSRKKMTSKFQITTTNPESDDDPSARRHKAVSSVRITVVTDKFGISSRSHLTKASHSSLTHFHTSLFLSFSGQSFFLFCLSFLFFWIWTIRIMQLPFQSCWDKNQLVLLAWLFSLCWLGGTVVEVSGGWGWGSGEWRVFEGGIFRHCHPVWAADCELCTPRSVNLWRTGFLAPPTPPCHVAPGSVPRGRAAPPPESPAPPSYAACTCNRDRGVSGGGLGCMYWFLLPCKFSHESMSLHYPKFSSTVLSSAQTAWQN